MDMAEQGGPRNMADLLDPASAAYKKARRHFHNATKNRQNDYDALWSPFRAAEKRYKARFPPPDLTAALDFAALDPNRTQDLWRGSPDALQFRRITLRKAVGSEAYAIPCIPGAVLDPDPLTHNQYLISGLVVLPAFVDPDRQRELIRWALCKQARDNETNLHAHYHLPEQGLWNAHLDAQLLSEEITVQPKGTPSGEQHNQGPRQLVDNTEASPETFNLIMSTPKPPQSPSGTLEPTSASALMYKLRWVNIGWFYHWGTKQYDFTRPRAPVDRIVKDLCQDAVGAVDWDQVFMGSENEWNELGPEWKTWDETYGE